MQKFFLLLLAATLSLGFAGCDSSSDRATRDAEIERRVEARMRQERLDDLEARLRDKELDLSDRAALLAEQERLLEDKAAAAAAEAKAAEKSKAPRAAVQPEGQVYTGGPGGDYEDENAVPVAQRVTYDRFYEDLQPYGDWYETDDYGYVYQPSQISGDWAPYTDGRWVYSDHGWTFVSDEPYGWATYHYGRWVRLRGRGWCWVPGDQWAPAWVSWRYSEDYVGWAPLPPEARFDRQRGITVTADVTFDIGPDHYNFVNVRNFGDRRLRGGIVPRDRNLTLVRDTRNVTSITYRNNAVFNQGPRYDELRRRSSRPVERVRVERESRLPRGKERGSRLDNNVLTLAAPVFSEKADRKRERPKEVKNAERKVETDRGWSRVEKEGKAAELRQKLREQAARAEAAQAVSAPPGEIVVEAASPDPKSSGENRKRPERTAADEPVVAGQVIESEASPAPGEESARRGRPQTAQESPTPVDGAPQDEKGQDGTEQNRRAAKRVEAEERQMAAEEAQAEQQQKAAEEAQAQQQQKAAEEAQAEQQQKTAEEAQAEQQRQAAEQAQAEQQKKAAEEAQAEQQRQVAEEAQAEQQRQAAEQAQAEQQKKAAEEAQAEQQRQAAREAQAEQQRQAAEEAQAEQQRQAAREAQAEQQRQAAEEAQAEQQRAAAQQQEREAARQQQQAARQQEREAARQQEQAARQQEKEARGQEKAARRQAAEQAPSEEPAPAEEPPPQ